MKYLMTRFLTWFIAQGEQKIEICDAQGNKIKEVIRNGARKENTIEPHELKAHNQEIKIKELEKENKILKNQVKELKEKIAKLNSDIKFKDMQISIKELAEKNNKTMNTSLTFLTIAQYLLFAVVILSIIGWIISLFTKKAKNDEI